ncbi:MAG: tetraacyldisaccharide 4'-kinase [Rikenellaceae bacterium]
MLKAVIASIYKTAIRLRHMLYDKGLLKIYKFRIPIICIGNVTVGGTGKTPMTELIVSHFSKSRKVAVLSRGYGRKTKGYIEVRSNSHYRNVGDEPLQIKLKYPEAVVVVCEKRVEGIRRIQAEHRDVELIIMDDGFQHRSVEPLINIITIDATRPIEHDEMLPLGTLRDVPEAVCRAHYFVVTKCPIAMKPIERRLMRKTLIHFAYQKLYFTRYISYRPEPLFPHDGSMVLNRESKVIAVSGLGNPKPFIDSLQRSYNLVDKIEYNDHHVYRMRDLKEMSEKLAKHPGSVVVITEKDAVKLRVPSKISKELRERIYYIPIQINFLDVPLNSFLNNLEDDIRENQANRKLHK